MDGSRADESGAFEVVEQRKFGARLSLLVAVLGSTLAAYLIAVDADRNIFSGKGSDMGPILILSAAFIVVAAIALLIPRVTRSFGPEARRFTLGSVAVLELVVAFWAWNALS